MKLQAWEYAVLKLDLRWSPIAQMEAMDEFGAEGWELRHMAQHNDTQITAYFFRPAKA